MADLFCTSFYVNITFVYIIATSCLLPKPFLTSSIRNSLQPQLDHVVSNRAWPFYVLVQEGVSYFSNFLEGSQFFPPDISSFCHPVASPPLAPPTRVPGGMLCWRVCTLLKQSNKYTILTKEICPICFSARQSTHPASSSPEATRSISQIYFLMVAFRTGCCEVPYLYPTTFSKISKKFLKFLKWNLEIKNEKGGSSNS